MMLERLNPKHRRTGPLEAAAISIPALLSSLDSGPVKALEIATETPWAVGITEKLRNAAVNEKDESATTYIQFSDTSSVWPSVVEIGPMGGQVSVTDEVQYLTSRYNGKEIAIRCQLHTHPSTMSIMGKTYQFPYLPPSPTDVSRSAGVGGRIENYFLQEGVPIKRSEYAPADQSGIWYHSITNKEFSKIDEKRWEEAYNTFVWSAVKPDFNFDKAYKELQKAYEEHLGAKVRFVSYEDINKEPPCAGIHYDPDKQTASIKSEPAVSEHKTLKNSSSSRKKSDDSWGPAAAGAGIHGGS